MTEQLKNIEITIAYLQDDDIARLQRQQRKAPSDHHTQAAEGNTRNQNLNSDHRLRLEGETPLTYSFPYYSTPHIDECLIRICKA
jgi:hypothetical protein